MATIEPFSPPKQASTSRVRSGVISFRVKQEEYLELERIADRLMLLRVLPDGRATTLVRRAIGKYVADFHAFEERRSEQLEQERIAREKEKREAEDVLRRLTQ